MTFAFSHADLVVKALTQVAHHRGLQGDGRIGFAVTARHVGTHTDQVPRLLEARPQLLELLSAAHVLYRHHRRHDPADRGFNIDRRVMALFGQAPG